MGYRESQNLKPIKIVDDFFDDPDKIREIALTCDYKNCSDHIIAGNWPGIRSDYIQNVLGEEIFTMMVNRMFAYLYPGKLLKDYYIESFFQLCGVDDGDSWVHQDMEWCSDISLIYMSPNPSKNSGTIIYEPIDCGFDAYNFISPSNYSKVKTIDNVYNRMVSHHPLDFHKSDTYFGSGLDSRLTIVSFIKFEFE